MPGRGSAAPVPCTAGRGTRLSAGGLDVFSAALFPGKALDLEEQRVRETAPGRRRGRRAAEPRIDLDSGVVYLERR